MNKKIITILSLLLLLNGCTKDDICPEGTASTPLLIIRFNDVENPLDLKSVSKLTIETDYDPSVTLYTDVTTDSIAIPLQTGSNNTRYRFIMNKGLVDEITDIYSFDYERNDIYINRACGFKTTYTEFTAEEVDSGPVDWIIYLIILDPIIEDETKAHITILH